MDKTTSELRHDLQKFTSQLQQAKHKAQRLVDTAKNMYRPRN